MFVSTCYLTTSTLLVVVVVVVMRLKDLLSEFLLSLVYVSIQFISILPDRELLIVINRDVDFSGANWFIIWVVELGYIGMFQGLLGC